MKKELDNLLVKISFAFCIFTGLFTLLEVSKTLTYIGILFSIIGLCVGIMCCIKKYIITGKINIIISSASLLISLVFLWMNLTK